MRRSLRSAREKSDRFRRRRAGGAVGRGAWRRSGTRPGSSISDRRQGGGSARGLQGFHQGSVRRVRHSDGRLRPLRSMRLPPGPIWRRRTLPIVIKADGLAAGKGVVIAETRWRTRSGDRACFSGAFGAAGAEVVIEEFLRGRGGELLCAVRRQARAGARHRAGSQARRRRRYGAQHRRHGRIFAGAGDDADMQRRMMDEIIRPTVAAMARARHAVQGRAVCWADDHARRPEADRIQRALRRSGDAGADAAAEVGSAGGAHRHGRWRARKFDLRWRDDAALTVVMAAKGYPGARQGQRDPRARGGGAKSRASKFSTQARGATATAFSPMAGACST